MTAEMYRRPPTPAQVRELEARVAEATAAKTTQAPDPLACFSRSLQARMRLLGWEQDDLQERAGIGAHVAARAIRGTGCDLAIAGKLAGLVGLDLAAMVGPYACGTCQGTPPAGYGCLECGTEGARQ